MQTEVFDTPESFLAALAGKPRSKRGRATRPDLPAAGRSPSTGLTSLIAPKPGSGHAAWSLAFEPAKGYRLYVINDTARDTGWQPSEREACDAAKVLR